ncbi:MAG: 4-hydroxy-3-methylbut-2-enyl diphosphate reductase [Chloroflexi bacterium]|nr:4-hydroxy-3-methylbut-2-enyl diphosphate reductase [Chloroflexota bacterium]MDA8187650.1 4-hydroxy-3-methylbut-2-enyl diphosphate reductase [Dehalococcoidales bacterium]
MQVKLAKEMGFCFGVRRGVSQVERAAQERGPLQTLGSLVHNQQVVDRLGESGVKAVHDLDEVKGETVAIATHGVAREVIEEAKARGIEVIDVTCPYVKLIQEKARQMHEAGFQVVVFGDRGHTEVIGIVGWTKGRAIVVSAPEEISALPRAKKVGIVAQTTQSIDAYEKVISRLVARCLPRSIELRIHNTICNATALRQSAAVKLADSVDVMVVVGGKNSANTRRLAELCQAKGVPTHHVEDAGELQTSWFAACNTVGVTAGASTPDWVIDEVVKRLEAMEVAD